MTDDEILSLAALTSNEPTDDEMIAFARACEAKEREACADISFETSLEALRNTPLRQALDQLPDTTKMMVNKDMVCVRYWVQDTMESGHWVVTEPMSRAKAKILLSEPYRSAFPQAEIIGMPDTGIDRGAWSDVPDATKWVDELRGDDEAWKPDDMSYRPNGLSVEESPNSTTDVVEPVAWIVPSYGFLFPNKDSAQRYLDNIESNAAPTPLYTAPPQREWVGLTEDEREAATGWSVEHIETKLKEKNT